jgi:hypothetical protein
MSQTAQMVPDNEATLRSLEQRIKELNDKATQLLTFLSFALVVAAILETSSGNRLGVCQAILVTFAMRCWVFAIFPILVGILPVKALLLCAAILLILFGTLFFLCAIWNAPPSTSGTWS